MVLVSPLLIITGSDRDETVKRMVLTDEYVCWCLLGEREERQRKGAMLLDKYNQSILTEASVL